MEEETHNDKEQEELCKTLNDDTFRAEYQKQCDDYRPAWFPRLAGGFLMWLGNFFYGEKPGYLKFRAVEVIARVPYHSWASAAYTLLTLFYTDEKKAMELSKVSHYARHAQDNETMHVVVVSCIVRDEGKRGGVFRHTIVPMVFAFLYFWLAYWLYLINPKYAYELNYLFENHAYEQYDRFLKENKDELVEKPLESSFLAWYGRYPRNYYDFFQSVRNDELIHRNRSVRDIKARS